MKVALIELGGSHDELLFSQAAFLKASGHTVLLIASENLRSRTEVFDNIDHFYYFDVGNHKPAPLLSIFQIWRLLRKNNVDKIVFNTAQGSTVRNFTLLPWNKIELIGIIHNINKLHQSGNQRLISLKIKKYFVLNEYMLDSMNSDTHLKIVSFYPIFFQKFNTISIEKKESEVWFCIPGLVEFKRRDYEGFLKAICEEKLAQNVRIIFLGRIGHAVEYTQIKNWLKKLENDDQVVLFKGYIDNHIFHSYLQKSDMILPLLHPDTERFHEYSSIQISGAFNLAFGHHKPLIMENFFKKYSIFSETSIFYEKKMLVKKINELAAKRTIIQKKQKDVERNEKFNFKVQQKLYMDLINE